MFPHFKQKVNQLRSTSQIPLYTEALSLVLLVKGIKALATNVRRILNDMKLNVVMIFFEWIPNKNALKFEMEMEA